MTRDDVSLVDDDLTDDDELLVDRESLIDHKLLDDDELTAADMCCACGGGANFTARAIPPRENDNSCDAAARPDDVPEPEEETSRKKKTPALVRSVVHEGSPLDQRALAIQQVFKLRSIAAKATMSLSAPLDDDGERAA